jgi:hypothetical protein
LLPASARPTDAADVCRKCGGGPAETAATASIYRASGDNRVITHVISVRAKSRRRWRDVVLNSDGGSRTV